MILLETSDSTTHSPILLPAVTRSCPCHARREAAVAFAGEWVACAERLPSADGPYLVFMGHPTDKWPLIVTAWYEAGKGWSYPACVQWVGSITHWTSMPAEPVEKTP